ncbi:malectin domain-containing carbohydrate-binding protein [Halorubrum sp. Hd13]|uniref:malectin domain-containing carbohydrate-binding protein n=1 Tax=Halorubrum sp. Hd13 TaxID=1480728 RepID=UPI0011400F05|nr:malectin domain-containing carbohydrate-binding protein [Halorubrum sp. Hd13]
MSASATTRFFAVAFSVLMLVSAMGAGIIGGAGVAQAQSGGDVIERVNAGGASVSTSSGPDWTADSGGSTYSSGGTAYTADSLSAGDVTNPTDAPSEVFLTERFGDHSWSFDVSSGTEYEVRLYFAEIYYGVNPNTDGADTGDRVFDASIEGQQVLNDYDIVAETGGAATATVETFEVTPSDGTIDVSFTNEVDNAKVSAIEVVEATPDPGVLGGPDSVDFGTVVTGENATESVTLSNEGESGDQSITVDGASVSGTDAGDFSTDFSGSVTLAPGETTDVPVTFSPSDAEAKSASLEVSHDAENTTSPLTVGLSGEGSSSVPVGFGHTELDGFSAGSPTSIDWGPDGRLYVSTQGGEVFALTVERNGEDSYQVTETETIDEILDIPNHNDDGSFASLGDQRLVTGLRVGGTADQPVLYVTSSDPRAPVGNDNPPEQSLDTNSGTISRLTQQSDGSWDHDVLVRGIARSEENHAVNGLAIADGGDTLYVAVGGHTNQGAPGDKLSYLPEYALSASILEVDVAQIESNNQPKDALDENGNAYADYYYDIPTLNPNQSNAPNGGPFGGLDGVNMAKLVDGGPVQVYSPGYRNPYDVVIRPNGDLYTIDNGHNGGWGDQPVGEGTNQCTNEINDGGGGGDNPLHHIDQEGYYGGHANPTRANPDGANVYAGGFKDNAGELLVNFSKNSPVEVPANPVECDWQAPGDDGALTTFGASTNGLGVYTADNFGGALDGALLAASFDGNTYYTTFNENGTEVVDKQAQFSAGLNTPLDVTAMDDGEAYPGTVWVADFGGNDIDVYEPDDYGDSTGGGDQCIADDPDDPDYDPDGDADGDGYTNQDENEAGSDPCSASSTPPDFDDDGISNLNDPDDDNDGTPDTEDPFAIDPDDGTTTTAPVEYSFQKSSGPGTILDLGFTGLMTNGTDYQDLYDTENVIAGAAAPVLTVEDVPPGDAFEGTNTQQYAFQSGVQVNDEPLTVHTTLEAPFSSTPEGDGFRSQGVYIGNGDQDNYVKLVVTESGATSGTPGLELLTEVNGNATNTKIDETDVVGSKTVDLYLDVYPGNDTAVARYAISGNNIDGTVTGTLGETDVPSSWLDSTDQGMAFGVISTSNSAGTFGTEDPYTATYTQLEVTQQGTETDNTPPSIDAISNQSVVSGENVNVSVSASDDDGDSVSLSLSQSPEFVTLADGEISVDPQSSDAANSPYTVEVTADDGTDTTTESFELAVDTATSTTAGTALARANAGGSTLSATDDGPDWTGVTGVTADGPLVSVSGTADNYNDGDDVTPGDEVSSSTPSGVYDAERFGAMTWEFDVPSDSEVEVRLYLSNQFPGANTSGDRQYNVAVEGDQVLTEYDPVQDVGQANGTVKAFTTTEDGDGNVSVSFTEGAIEFPQVNAIEVVEPGTSTPEPEASADVAITPGSGIEASTYGGGSFEVTNTGEQNIESVTIDLSTTTLPDMVFDPEGTAGDGAAKGLSIDSESGDGVGVVSVADSDVFSQPHNGQNDSDGYDVLTIEFTDFDPGETVAFSADNDPTSIKGATISSQEAGPVSGLELARATVDVGYSDGTTQTTQTIGDGSPGGAEAVADGDVPAAPSIGVQNVSLDGSVLDGYHSAATVTDAAQTVTVSGPANADVTLVRVEGELELDNVPDYNGTPGYDIEDYEANKAEDVEYYSTTLDSNGEAAIPVTLTDSTDVGSLNYFVAAVEDGDGAGLASDAVVLELDEGSAPTVDSITDKGVTEGESLTVDVPASDADGDALDLSVSGPSFVALNDQNDTLTVAPGDDMVGTYGVTVTADDGNATASESFAVYVDEPDQNGTVVTAVNAGGGNYTASDGTEYVASADSDVFSGGSTYSVNQSIAATEDDTLYQTELFGEGDGAPNVDVPVENGTYEVTLQFTEIFQGVSDSDSPDSSTPPTDGTNENDRLFSATVEGEEVLTEYDIYSEVGPLNATDKTYTVNVTDGELNVDFAVTNDNAKISAIKVEEIDTGDEIDTPIDGFENAPTDPDGDGLYEDVNGDGDVNVGDAQAIFSNADDPVVQNNTDAFDYNGDGSVNSGDAQALFANGLAAGDDDGTEA